EALCARTEKSAEKTELLRPENWITLATDPTLEIGPGARLLSTATYHQAFLIRGGLHRFPRAMNWFGLPATYAAAFAEARSILRESVSNRPTAIRQLCAQRASKMAGSCTLSLVVFLDSVHPDTLLIQLGRSACPANSALMPLVRRHLAPNTWHLLLNPLERALL